MSSIFNPIGGTTKIFVEGLGEVEVSVGLDSEWQQRFLEDGYEGDAGDENEMPPIVAARCPDCKVMIEDFVVHFCTR